MFPKTVREVGKNEGINTDIRRSSIKIPIPSKGTTPPDSIQNSLNDSLEVAITAQLLPGSKGRTSFSPDGQTPSTGSPLPLKSQDIVGQLAKVLRNVNVSSPTVQTIPEVTGRNRFQFLLPPSWQRLVLDWFHEDIPVFDYGGFVVGETEQVATLYGKNKVC